MVAAVRATGEVPDHPGVGVAEDGVAALGRLAYPVDVLQDPLDLAAGEVRGRRQAGLAPDDVAAAVAVQRRGDPVGPGVLPHDRVVDRLAGVPVPDDRCLALVGDPDRGQVGGGDAGLFEPAPDDLLAAHPDLGRIVLDPARFGIDLLVLLLVDCDHLPAMVEDHEAGAGRPLVEGTNVFRHPVPPVLRTPLSRRVRVGP
jgi:hypothetical protein